MAVRLSIILFLLLPVIAQAQLKSDFVGICTFDDFVNTTGDNYRGDILNFIDRYNLGVSTKNIQIGDEIVDGSGDVFEVLTIHSTASNFEADVTVQARVSASGAPTGSGQVYRPSANGIIPPGSVDNLGLSNVTKGLIDMHNALRLDSLLGTVANGDSIIAVGFANDSLSITMESDTVYTAIIPVDSLHQLQADSIAALYDSLGVKVDTIIAGNNINITYANGQYTISAPDPNVGTDDQTAGEVWYNDTYLPLNVNDVQQAIDSLKRDLDAVSAGASDGVATAGTLDVGNEEIDVTVAAPGSAFSIDISGIETLSSFSGWDMNAADDFSGAWGDLTGVPAGFADNVDDVDDADADATNEGSLTVAAGSTTTAVINSNTSGSTGVTIEAQAGIGITENTGTGTIFIENTGDLSATNEIDIIGFTGDVGSAQQIGDGEFLDLEGGYGIVTTMSTDKANFKVDTTQVATVWALADSLSNISGGGTPLASNGLSVDADTVELGGNLTQNTVIQGQNLYDLTFSTIDVLLSNTRNDFSNATDLWRAKVSLASESAQLEFELSKSDTLAKINEDFTVDEFGRFRPGASTIATNPPDTGYVGYNSTTGNLEQWDGSTWNAIGTGTGGSAFWEDASGTVRTVSASSGLDFVFGSSQLDDSGNAAEDDRFLFDNSKGYFAAGRFQGTQVNDANRGIAGVNLGLNNQASGNASVAAGGQNNAATGTGAYVHGENGLASIRNQYAHAGGGGGANSGETQYTRLIAWAEKTGTGNFNLYLDGSSEVIAIPNNTLYVGRIEVGCIATVADGVVELGDHKYMRAGFTAKNIGGTISTQIIDDTDALLDDTDFDNVSISLFPDNTNDAMTLTVSNIPGGASSETTCTATLQITQTSY